MKYPLAKLIEEVNTRKWRQEFDLERQELGLPTFWDLIRYYIYDELSGVVVSNMPSEPLEEKEVVFTPYNSMPTDQRLVIEDIVYLKNTNGPKILAELHKDMERQQNLGNMKNAGVLERCISMIRTCEHQYLKSNSRLSDPAFQLAITTQDKMRSVANKLGMKTPPQSLELN